MPAYTSSTAFNVDGRDEVQLWYETPGAGPDVVLLHPTPAHHGFWLPVAQKLAEQYRVVLPDLRGHGRSEPAEGPVTVERLAGDIIALLDALRIERALFAGCSIGGYTLFELWRMVPQRVAALAFCCSKPQPDGPANKLKRAEWIAEVTAQGPNHFFEAMSTSLVGPTARQLDPAKVAQVRAMMEPVTAQTVVAVQQGLGARPDSLPTAATIDVPVCVIAGGEDASSTPAEMKLLADSIPGAEYHLLMDAGHYAPWEQPEVVAAILGRFFESALSRG